MGKFSLASGGKVFLIVVVDYFTKWVEAEAVVKADDRAIQKFLWKNICCRYRVSRVLIDDNGAQFTGTLLFSKCKELKIEQRFVVVAHPQANGQVEVTNRTIMDEIRTR